MEAGLELLKNWGLASFWRPAKRNVTPRNRRRGISTQPVTTVPSGCRMVHMGSWTAAAGRFCVREAAARARLDALDVTGLSPWSGQSTRCLVVSMVAGGPDPSGVVDGRLPGPPTGHDAGRGRASRDPRH